MNLTDLDRLYAEALEAARRTDPRGSRGLYEDPGGARSMTGNRRTWISRRQKRVEARMREHWMRPFLWNRKTRKRVGVGIDPTKPVTWTMQRFTYDP